MVIAVKGFFVILALAASLGLAGCGFFGPSEASRQESGRTVYRAAEENPEDVPDVIPVRRKVPGETR
jgi:hypothetical protein